MARAKAEEASLAVRLMKMSTVGSLPATLTCLPSTSTTLSSTAEARDADAPRSVVASAAAAAMRVKR